MPEIYSTNLGNAVKRARGRLKLTQYEVAALADIDSRTVLNIENYKGNPKLEVLYPLVRVLRLDPREIFIPEMQNSAPFINELRVLMEGCSEDEASALIPIITSVLAVLRSKETATIN